MRGGDLVDHTAKRESKLTLIYNHLGVDKTHQLDNKFLHLDLVAGSHPIVAEYMNDSHLVDAACRYAISRLFSGVPQLQHTFRLMPRTLHSLTVLGEVELQRANIVVKPQGTHRLSSTC